MPSADMSPPSTPVGKVSQTPDDCTHTGTDQLLAHLPHGRTPVESAQVTR